MNSTQVVMDLDEALTYCDHDLTFLRVILEQYWRLWPDTRADIEQAIGQQDRSALEKISHRLKGQAATLAARQVQVAADKLEHASTPGGLDPVQPLFDALIRAQHALRQFHIDQDLIDDDTLPPV